MPWQMNPVIVLFWGLAILGAVGVYVILRAIRRLVELRKARVFRVHQLERQVKELTERIRPLEGAATSEAVELILSFRLSTFGRTLQNTRSESVRNADRLERNPQLEVETPDLEIEHYQ